MDESQPLVGRFAPTPSGRLHLGNLMCALVAWLSVRSRGGRFLLRIEDLDAARCPYMGENTKYLFDDLQYLGIDWDGDVLWQSKRAEIYETYVEKLREQGLLYPCYCSRAELHAATAPHRTDMPPVYSGKCRPEEGVVPLLRKDKAPAWRVRVPVRTVKLTDVLEGTYEEELFTACGDFIVRRSDGVFAYQLAVVVDDGLSHVSEVVRGNDLLTSTPRQMYLQELFGFKHPTYAHIPLLTDATGRRLSKRDGDGCMVNIREKYRNSAPVVGALAAALGLIPSPEPMRPTELIPLFDFSKIRRGTVPLPEHF